MALDRHDSTNRPHTTNRSALDYPKENWVGFKTPNCSRVEYCRVEPPNGIVNKRVNPIAETSRLVLHVRHHLAAGLRAVPAGFGTVGHVLVILEFLARFGTLVIALRAALARLGAERAHPGGQGRR
jgi:hypothetical protein